jgi:hypothetical protein
MQLKLDDLSVTSFETGDRYAMQQMAMAAAACTPTLDSLVDAICPDGLTVGCHETTVVE